MRKVEVGLRVAALQLNTWALFTQGRGKIAQRSLQIVALLLFGLMITVFSLAHFSTKDTLEVKGAPIRAEFATAERQGTHGATEEAMSTPAVQSDIVLPDIFIPVPADFIVPAPNHSSAPATKSGTFKNSER